MVEGVTFQLISGSEEDASSWHACRAALAALGYATAAVSLHELPWKRGFGPALCELQRWAGAVKGPRVVVGHSAGGLLLPRLSEGPGVLGEGYVAALVPEPGRSFLDQLFEERREEVFTPQWLAEIRRAPRPSGEFLRPLYEARWAGPFPPVPRAYFVCGRDEMIRAPWQRLAAARLPGGQWVEHDLPHDPQLAAPDRLARWLAAQAVAWQWGYAPGSGSSSSSTGGSHCAS